MQNTNNLNFGFYQTLSNDAQDIKDIKSNENALISSVISHPLLYSLAAFNAPPQSAMVNCCYLIGSSPNAEFEGFAGKIAFYNQNGWRFFELINGITFFVSSLSAFYYYFNGEFLQLVPPQQVQNNSTLYKIGDYKNSAINYDHDGFLLCDGRSILRSTYSQLFAVVGTAFGSGDNSTTFTLPDFKGRVFGSIGQGGGLSSRTLGQKIGAETHTLSIAEMPSHSHNLTNVAGVGGDVSNPWSFPGGVTVGTRLASGSTGSNSPHNNMQPTLFAGGVFIYSGVV